MQRKRIKHATTFEEGLTEEARQFREEAEKEPPGSTARELLLRRARQAETASHMNDWLASLGLWPPKDPRRTKKYAAELENRRSRRQ